MASVHVFRDPPTPLPITEVVIKLSFDEAVKLLAIIGRVSYCPAVISDLYSKFTEKEIKEKASQYAKDFVRQEMVFRDTDIRNKTIS